MAKLEAVVDMPFGVGVKKKGERFEATTQEANLLVALKRARIVEEDAEAKEAAPASPAQGTAAEVVAEKATSKPKRTYTRRDMKAQP